MAGAVEQRPSIFARARAGIGRGVRAATDTFLRWEQRLIGGKLPRNWSWFGRKPRQNSIVVAVVRWVQRSFSEAPPMVERWVVQTREWENISSPLPTMRTRVLAVLEQPNPYYNGPTLWKATVADLMLTGNAFWLKVQDAIGSVAQLWYVPSNAITPLSVDPRVPIQAWRITTARGTMDVPRESVVHFRDGIDPDRPALGLSPLQALLREIDTDETAAGMTNRLLENMGVPGVIIAPKAPLKYTKQVADAVAAAYEERVSGDEVGKPLVLQGDSEVTTFGFNPQQMRLRDIRGVPEERITAVLGVNSAVVGLGVGLATTKVGATLKEYREEAVESTIAPMYREIAATITQQLLPDFGLNRTYRLNFDLSQVRVLQEDRLRRSQRLVSEVTNGIIQVAEARRQSGYQIEDFHQVFLIKSGLKYVKPNEILAPPPAPATMPPNPPEPPEQQDPQTDDEPPAAA